MSPKQDVEHQADRLAYPEGRVGAEAPRALGTELACRFHQSNVAFLDQVEQGELLVWVKPPGIPS